MISQPDIRWKRCDIKSTNLLANVLAIEAAHRAGRSRRCSSTPTVRDRGDPHLAALGAGRAARGDARGATRSCPA